MDEREEEMAGRKFLYSHGKLRCCYNGNKLRSSCPPTRFYPFVRRYFPYALSSSAFASVASSHEAAMRIPLKAIRFRFPHESVH